MSDSTRGNRGGSFWRGRGRGWKPYQKKTKPRIGLPGSENTTNNSPTSSGVSSSSNQQRLPDVFQAIPCPYRGWKLYHTQEGFREGSPTVMKVEAVENYIRKNIKTYSASDIMERRAFSIDVKSLVADNDFINTWPTFKEDLFEKPEYTLNNLGLAMHQVAVNEIENKLKEKMGEGNTSIPAINVPIIRARITGYEPILQLKHLKANYYNKMVAINGTIIRVGNIKLLCVWLAFECMSCHSLQCIKQPEGTYTPPTKCGIDKCKSRQFLPVHSSPYTRTINWQCVRVQEIVADDQREGGRVPRTIECELTEDLLDSCLPGGVVTIIGVMKVRNNEEGRKQKAKAPSLFLLYLEGISVINSKSSSINLRNSAMGVKLDAKDFCAIREIQSQPSLFRLLVHSLCPTIYGHELVKAGLLLTLFGGSQKHSDSRCEPHILVVGDPGLGKSQMLQACSAISPRGVYVCGNSSTSAGLTVTLTRESGGDHALEAGALVLADQGCCCIDEFDKMTSQHAALLEVMEQQSVSIAKAGVICSLPARTSILAAANPSGGHYNKAKTISENLRIGPALLSRFDLVFILLDKPNEHLDSLLSEHVMALHSAIKPSSQSSFQSSGIFIHPQNTNTAEKQPLGEQLKLISGESIDPVPHQLLRKYLAYARKHIHPVLSKEAAEVLQKFYLELRKQHQTVDSTPVTTRQLESLIRLSESRAKVELREEVIMSDALDVVEIMRHSLVDAFTDEIGGLDFKRSQNGSGFSSKNQAKRFINALQKRADVLNRSIFSTQELKEVSNLAGVEVNDLGDFISSLNVQGFLLKKGPKLYQLLTVDY